jgi:hypothetical protein
MSTRGASSAGGVEMPTEVSLPRRRDDVVDLRDRRFFQLGVVRQRTIGTA